jgi:hypothetical protein
VSLNLGDVHAYENSSAAMLCIGVPEGRTRPAIWFRYKGVTVMIAQFHGEQEALAMIEFMDTHTDDINKVIQHLTAQQETRREDEGK